MSTGDIDYGAPATGPNSVLSVLEGLLGAGAVAVAKTPDPDPDPNRGDLEYRITFLAADKPNVPLPGRDAGRLGRARAALETDLQAATAPAPAARAGR